MRIEIKGFIIPHIGDPLEKCQDCFAIDTNRLAFAVSDGVTMSLLSSFMSQHLTSDYVNNPIGLFQIEGNSATLKKDYTEEFTRFYNKKHSESDTRGRFRLELTKERCGFSAATFVGCYFDDNCWKYVALGDSFLVFVSENGENIRYYSSMSNEQFGYQPEYFSSNGNHKGAAISGTLPIEDGYLLLMTDEMSKWFFNNCKVNQNIAKELFSLNNHVDYLSWRDEKIMGKEMDDDDCTLLIVHITNALDQEEITYETLYLDNVEEINAEVAKMKELSAETSIEEQKKNIDSANTEQVGESIEGVEKQKDTIANEEKLKEECASEGLQNAVPPESSVLEEEEKKQNDTIEGYERRLTAITNKMNMCLKLMAEINEQVELLKVELQNDNKQQ
jgi:hypothetical protein